MKTWQVSLLLALFLSSTMSFAGEWIEGRGATPELACWDYNFKANQFAYGRGGGCYESCKGADKVTHDAAKNMYVFKLDAPNNTNSCGASRYDRRTTYTDEAFRQQYPVPSSLPRGPANAGAARRGITTVSWFSPRENFVRVIITNRTLDRGITTISVWARDAGYSAPTREIAQETLTVEPGSSEVREFHSWRGTEWFVKQL